MRVTLLLLLAISLAQAVCSGHISSYVPAVVEEGGSLVNVSMTLVTGHGNAYVTASPTTGISTQQSIDEAIAYAHSLSGKGEGCDVLVSFSSEPPTDYIEGPSAGTAITVMAYALLENRTIRNDTIITGTIDDSGDVGAVGGLYEKVKGAASIGASYFITPVESLYEMLLLRKMESRYGIKILQARRVEQVIGFMLDNETIPQTALSVENREIPDPPPYDASGLGSFGAVASHMVELEKGLVESLPDDDNDSAVVKGFFSNEVARQEKIEEKGYLFSAANEAFLNYIDLSTIRVIIGGDADLPRKKGEAGVCLSGIIRPNMTEDNFEWVVGADMRQNWAYDKLDDTVISDNLLEDEKYVAYNELMYAQAWCEVAKELINASTSEGAPVNESAWKDIADDMLSEANKLDMPDEDTANRLDIAEESYKIGHYGAAIYDSVYVIETVEASLESADSGAVETLVEENRSSLWGRVYQSHAAFLFTQNETEGAYRTALFAKGLDNATARMRESLTNAQNASASPGGETDEENASPGEDLIKPLLVIAVISIFLFLILLLLMTRRNYGYYGPGPGKAYRVKQKKG